jgi:hypothetical protein
MRAGVVVSLLLAVALVGCGRLQIQVDVLDPKEVEREIDRVLIRDALPDVLAQSDEGLRTKFNALFEQHEKFYADLAVAYRNQAATLSGDARMLSETAANALVPDFRRFIGPLYDVARNDVQRLNTEIRALEPARAAPGAPPTATSDLAQKLRQRNERFLDFSRFVLRNTNDKLKGAARELNRNALEPIRASAETVRQASNTLIQGRDLLDSPYTFAVASADDTKWSPYYNRTIGGGYLGNFDMAVKMVSLGDFTIKGLLFDPSDVARAISRVAVQALVLSAQMSGVPVRMPPPSSSGRPPADGTALAESSAALAQIQDTTARTEAKLADYREALVLIAQAILRERDQITRTTDERGAANAAIKGSFDAHKARLQLQTQ